MTAGAPFPQHAEPYTWDDNQSSPQEIVRLWTDVGNGIDKSQTVVWKSAVESLDAANKFLRTSEEARYFVEKYMSPIISILVEQQPTKIGPHERNCVQESLALAVSIVSRDLEIQLQRSGECLVLDVLSLVFNKKKAYYKGNKGNWNVNHLSGLPEVRLKMIDRFRQEQGFSRLHRYLLERINTPFFPGMESLHQVLSALGDALPNRSTGVDAASAKEMEDAAIDVARATMQFISSCSDDALKKLPSEHLNTVQHDLQRIFDRLVSTRRDSTYDFYKFWRALVLKLITSQSLPLKLFGWQQVDDLLDASADHRPPPKAFEVTTAGCTFVNGKYSFTGATSSDGYAQRGVDISYERKIPESVEDGGGKKLTLFRCTMRSQQKWWFLSEADEEQPGTDRDIDYYQHKSKEHEEMEPPPKGWVTCRNAGIDPPPQLSAIGLMVPFGEEFNTLEHQLAKWAIENRIIEIVLGDSVHREVVARSTALIKFLASMCERDNAVESVGGREPNMFCLQTSHLLLAWKTCTRKADAAVSAQVYQLLVSILPSCPSTLAIPLLKAVQASLFQSKEKRDYLSEVSEFCSALAAANSADTKAASTISLRDDVRAEVLELLWSVLTHPDASSLKSYDNLKRYITNELRVEPKGSEHRESYLRSCLQSLSANSRQQSVGAVDETQATRVVKLTHFVLEACPRKQAAELVLDDQGALPLLLFNELIAFLKRRQNGSRPNPSLRQSPSMESESKAEANPLSERLRILRYVYGLNDKIYMNSSQLHGLWQLCNSPYDREEVMIFIASASGTGHVSDAAVVDPPMPNQQPDPAQTEDNLVAAFTEEVCAAAFLNLFCSANVSFQLLGEGAYRSFQFMFNKLRISPANGQGATAAALDTLWRICLGSSNDAVATQAMKDLLAVYAYGTENSWTGTNTASDQMQTESTDESFGKRVFDCLANVKRGLDEKDPSAELAAKRCLRILNAAIGQGGTSGSIASSTLARLTTLSQNDGLRETVKYLPHGMRGQACYRKIGVMAKRTQPQAGPQPQQAYQETTGSNTNPARNPAFRFSLDVHPLETLLSIKSKVATFCQCPITSVKPISVNGRLAEKRSRIPSSDATQLSLNVVPDDSVVDELGIVQGCEMVFVIAERQMQQNNNGTSAKASRSIKSRNLSDIFCNETEDFADKLYQTLLSVLEALPWREPDEMSDESSSATDTYKLVWDLLLAMPTNTTVAAQVLITAESRGGMKGGMKGIDDDAMEIDTRHSELWTKLLDLRSFHRSVYVLLAIDAFLQPAVEVLSCLPSEQRAILERETKENALSFRHGFIESGGFDAVVRFFSGADDNMGMSQSMTRMGNAVALRILKCCLFSNSHLARQSKGSSSNLLDEAGSRLLQSLSDAEGLLRSLTAMVVGDSGISTSTISDILKFLQLLFRTPSTAQSFVSLPDGMAEKFLITLLLWEGGTDASRPSSSISAASKVRKNTHDLIRLTPILADHALPWLIRAIDDIRVTSDSTSEYFDVLQKLVADERSTARSKDASDNELSALATAVCKKLASCQRPSNETAMVDFSTGVLCGCLALLRALIESRGGIIFKDGTSILIKDLNVTRWSEIIASPNKGMFSLVSLRSKPKPQDLALIDLMGVVFDAFLSPGGSSSVVSICCDKESRQRGFDVVGAAARSCAGVDGYLALVTRVNGLVVSAAPFLKHRWGQVAGGNEGHIRSGRITSKYSGLKNQGCTCYMNSVLQQMFMMPELRKSLCSAPLPAIVRASGGALSAKGAELVGKKVAMQWDNGVSYDAIVQSFDKATGMHTIRYCPMQVATVGGSSHPQVLPEDIAVLPPLLPEEFLLSEGRPGKETGVFEVVSNMVEEAGAGSQSRKRGSEDVEETEDEAASRHLMEEVQRTFIHLDEGSRGRCFDPRGLVEACACLKLEFDVWQQNDASEFATKLLDRLEISLKRWAPEHFRYLDHTFGLKQTKQKICKECGLKTNREEKLLSVDCQIRGKSDIHEALGAMTEVEIMEGNNQVYCDRCKKNTDTILRSALSTLPNMLILSLKRFDLDYNTFETVKLNSRCAFGQTLNMKRYTLEGLEAMEQVGQISQDDGTAPMDTGTDEIAMSHLPDQDYEYKLAGVLVHAGVAQGGHYYSFIKDRNPKEENWYRFDDEEVTPFDPASIEVECFGGKVKKETKWPNGQVHTVESEQYANALMLFYEKVKPTNPPPMTKEEKKDAKKNAIPKNILMTSGYDVFEPDVRRSNATHRWQTFLFDAEFQAFLKGLLGLCRMSSSDMGRTGDSPPNKVTASISERGELSWRGSMIQMLLTFVFDVLLYSCERTALGDWIKMFEVTMSSDRNCARTFLAKLASKSRDVSGNWLRTYLTDCPDQVARTAAVRLFSAAVQSSISLEDEQERLGGWAQACRDQLAKIETVKDPLPCGLEGEWKSFEDPQSASVSCIGVILSFLNVLIDASPRNWRYSPELCLFIRNLASMDPNVGGELLRKAMVDSLVPARLTCLVVRERGPAALRAAFPGASVAIEVAETQMRAEQNPSPVCMSLSGNQVLNPSDMNYRGGGSPIDYLSLFEALGCLLRIRGVVHAPLVIEVDEAIRGRQGVTLSDQAASALRVVFEESCAPSAIGMGQREIELYLQKCGVDSVPTQKIVDIMAKYPTATSGSASKGSSYLSLEGFLAYYRDTAQTNDVRVRHDLHTFGFRPDLSRRSVESRVFTVDGNEQQRTSAESVTMDVASSMKDRMPNLGTLAGFGLSTFQLYATAYGASEPLAEHILAGSLFGRDSEMLIVDTLKAIYSAPAGWVGNETLNAALMILRVLASIPDERQRDRITYIMQCTERPVPHIDNGIGLVVAARAFYSARSAQAYPNEIHYAFDRYVSILKELLGLHSIFLWMTDNRAQWTWMEHDLLADSHHQAASQPGQGGRGEYSGHREGDVLGVPIDHHHSDSEGGMPCMNESEEDDDEDSRFEEMETYHDERVQNQVVVKGAGNPVVNGVYGKDGYFERACKYSRTGEYEGKTVLFSIFQCNVSNNTKHWYISIVPATGQPGTNADTDFYSAPVTESCTEFPPLLGWTKANDGRDPPPYLGLESIPVVGDSEPAPAPRVGWTEPASEEHENGGGSYV